GEPLGAAEIQGAREKLHWPYEPFEVPDHIYADWRKVANRGAAARDAWTGRLSASPKASAFTARMKRELDADVVAKLNAYKQELSATVPKVATRKASEMVLGVLNAASNQTIGGSADLTHSNYTITKDLVPIKPGEYSGRYIHYGI